MKLKQMIAAASLVGLAASPVSAVELTVSLTNLTQGMIFTPRLLVAHNANVDLFQAGTAASDELIAIAEGGNTTPYTDLLAASHASDQANSTFGGLVDPATTTSNYTFDTEDYPYLSMLTMLIPTNDAFVGLDSWEIPTEPGTYTINLNAYDAGSEDNDEINSATTTLTTSDGVTTDTFGGAPGRPGMAAPTPTQANLGSGATGVGETVVSGELAVDAGNPNGGEGNVHIHRNVLGDADSAAGDSDLNSSVHRWLNPVARLTVIVPEPATAP